MKRLGKDLNKQLIDTLNPSLFATSLKGRRILSILNTLKVLVKLVLSDENVLIDPNITIIKSIYDFLNILYLIY